MATQQNPGGEKIKVVLADDARHLLEMEKSFFPEREFAVSLAQNGCEAYNQVKTVRPHIVFLDLYMPLLNGEECCRLIKSDLRLSATRVVLVSRDDEQQIRRCHDAQCDLVIAKPVRRKEFLSAVHDLVGDLPRVPKRQPLRIAAELYDGARNHEAVWTVNLSEGGAYLEIDRELPVRGEYALTLKLDDQRTLTVPIRIAWANYRAAQRNPALPPGIGLQFLGLDDVSRRALRVFLGGSADGVMRTDSIGQHGNLFVELPMLASRRDEESER